MPTLLGGCSQLCTAAFDNLLCIVCWWWTWRPRYDWNFIWLLLAIRFIDLWTNRTNNKNLMQKRNCDFFLNFAVYFNYRGLKVGSNHSLKRGPTLTIKMTKYNFPYPLFEVKYLRGLRVLPNLTIHSIQYSSSYSFWPAQIFIYVNNIIVCSQHPRHSRPIPAFPGSLPCALRYLWTTPWYECVRDVWIE